MKLSSPIKRLKNRKILITLPYGDTSFSAIYKAKGWNIISHNGIDCLSSPNAQEAYGVPIIAAHDGTVIKTWFDNPMSTKGNGVELQSPTFYEEDGIRRMYATIYWHLSEVNCKVGDIKKTGDELGRCGNSGYVIGNDTTSYSGTHLHFMLYILKEEGGKWIVEYKTNGNQGAVDPLLFLEPKWKENAPIVNEIPKEAKLYPIQWAIQNIAIKIKNLIALWKSKG